MSYKVKLDNFEGPFDLLCYLIENAEMNIYDIQVARITAQYIAYIEEMQSRDLVVGGEFMVLAATLIELKSKMLLPRVKADGSDAKGDPRDELAHKLLEYKKFREAAGRLTELEERAVLIIEKSMEDLQPYTGEPDEYLRMDLKQFMQAFRLFLARKQRVEEVRRHYERVEKQRDTVEAKILFIRELFQSEKKRRLRFQDLLKPESDRFEAVLTFVALLEMTRNGIVNTEQIESFGEIAVELRAEEAP
jgi:segregation and condensation protein A